MCPSSPARLQTRDARAAPGGAGEASHSGCEGMAHRCSMKGVLFRQESFARSFGNNFVF